MTQPEPDASHLGWIHPEPPRYYLHRYRQTKTWTVIDRDSDLPVVREFKPCSCTPRFCSKGCKLKATPLARRDLGLVLEFAPGCKLPRPEIQRK
jgi:hypothetical protein